MGRNAEMDRRRRGDVSGVAVRCPTLGAQGTRETPAGGPTGVPISVIEAAPTRFRAPESCRWPDRYPPRRPRSAWCSWRSSSPPPRTSWTRRPRSRRHRRRHRSCPPAPPSPCPWNLRMPWWNSLLSYRETCSHDPCNRVLHRQKVSHLLRFRPDLNIRSPSTRR